MKKLITIAVGVAALALPQAAMATNYNCIASRYVPNATPAYNANENLTPDTQGTQQFSVWINHTPNQTPYLISAGVYYTGQSTYANSDGYLQPVTHTNQHTNLWSRCWMVNKSSYDQWMTGWYNH